MRVTRRYRFSAAHRLCTPALSDEENRRVYGKCNNPYGHGHDYLLEVSAQGPVEERSGRVLDPAALDGLVRRTVLEAFHHRDLNREIPELADAPPTTENLAQAIWQRLSRSWRDVFPAKGPRLSRIRIQETRRNSFEIMEER